jgi:putative ABC transport system permease protein
MRILDSIRMAAGGLRERKMRTALTLLGIVIGTGMIVALEASTQGQSKAISDQLEKLGPTTLIMQVGGFGPNQRNFTQTDLQAVQGMDHVQTAFLAVEGNGDITRSGETDTVSILGIDPGDIPTLVKGLQIQQGDFYQSGDLTSVVLGATAATPTDTTKLPSQAGDSVQVAVQVREVTAQGRGAETTVTRTYVATGIAAPFGSAPFVNVDNTVFMTPRAAQELLNIPISQYNQMVVIADSPDNVNAVQSELQAQYANARVFSGTQLASTISGVFQTISTLLGSIAAISLIVAGVGIANTMFVSVIERTTEIGTLKALGFKAREVLSIFLLEASLTGAAGGILGCLFGVVVAFGIGSVISLPGAAARVGGGSGAQRVVTPTAAGGGGGGFARGGFGGGGAFGGGGGGFSAAGAAAHAPPAFTVGMFATVIVFAILVAVLAGVIPARKAAKLDPVIALKRL